METMIFKIEGMSCSCEGNIIEKRMKRLQGVSIKDIEKAASKAGVKAVLLTSK